MTTLPNPSLLRGLPALPQPRGITRQRAGQVTFDAVCPHGRDTQWVAVRDDARSECNCTCPEDVA